jgi:hypothetical protein
MDGVQTTTEEAPHAPSAGYCRRACVRPLRVLIRSGTYQPPEHMALDMLTLVDTNGNWLPRNDVMYRGVIAAIGNGLKWIWENVIKAALSKLGNGIISLIRWIEKHLGPLIQFLKKVRAYLQRYFTKGIVLGSVKG